MDVINFMQYAAALLFVLALAGTALVIKRYGSNPQAFRDSFAGKLGKWDFKLPERRLAVVETLMLGPKQRLIIIRRDNVEHLVLSGPEGATVIESNFTSTPSGLRSAGAATATSPFGADAQGGGSAKATP